jgi:hypothetical protein
MILSHPELSQNLINAAFYGADEVIDLTNTSINEQTPEPEKEVE